MDCFRLRRIVSSRLAKSSPVRPPRKAMAIKLTHARHIMAMSERPPPLRLESHGTHPPNMNFSNSPKGTPWLTGGERTCTPMIAAVSSAATVPSVAGTETYL